MAVNINITVVWYVTQCSLVGKYQFLEGIVCLHLQDRRAGDSFGTLVSMYQITRRQVPEVGILTPHLHLSVVCGQNRRVSEG